MEIRNTTLQDLDLVMEIYAGARRFMAEHGNPRQWGATCWPPRELILQDIQDRKSYVCTEKGQVLAVFYFTMGEDPEPCYHEILEGAWRDPGPYGVIHRIASADHTRGVGTFCVTWAIEQCRHLRIDTHPDNHVMQRFLDKNGFHYCGIIHIMEDNDPRLAYEKTLP